MLNSAIQKACLPILVHDEGKEGNLLYQLYFCSIFPSFVRYEENREKLEALLPQPEVENFRLNCWSDKNFPFFSQEEDEEGRKGNFPPRLRSLEKLSFSCTLSGRDSFCQPLLQIAFAPLSIALFLIEDKKNFSCFFHPFPPFSYQPKNLPFS